MLKARQATTVTCKTCGSVYVRQAERVNFRGKDEKNCEVCGELLESWHGRPFNLQLVKRGELPKR
jgi:ribosomal protein S27E